MYTLWFDGLFHTLEANPSPKSGLMCYGWLVFSRKTLVARGHGGVVGGCDATSNCAEYLALIEGLEAMLDMGVEKEAVKVYGDARSVIDQMQGRVGVNSPSTLPLFHQASRLARHFMRLRWTWVPRKNNRDADFLTRHAMRQIYADRSSFMEAVQAASRGARRKAGYIPLADLRIYQPA